MIKVFILSLDVEHRNCQVLDVSCLVGASMSSLSLILYLRNFLRGPKNFHDTRFDLPAENQNVVNGNLLGLNVISSVWLSLYLISWWEFDFYGRSVRYFLMCLINAWFLLNMEPTCLLVCFHEVRECTNYCSITLTSFIIEGDVDSCDLVSGHFRLIMWSP